MIQWPAITALLSTAAACLALLPPTLREALYFDYQRLIAGNGVGLVSGHWLHVDTGHMVWNVLALAILGALIESQSRRLLLWSLVLGTASVDLLLLSPLSDLVRYCGLSGLLNTLMGVVLFLLWNGTRSLMVPAIGLLWVIKTGVELQSGQSLLTAISWPPYAPAHLAGMVAAPLALLLGHRRGGDTAVGRKQPLWKDV
jgi:membrane associated rhomboid family serine protease